MTSKDKLERLYDDYEYLMQEYYKCPVIGLKEEQIIQTKENVNHIQQDLDLLEKLEKVIEILKNKKPNLFTYFRNKKIYTENFVNREITQEEYDLLKEVIQ